MKSILIFGASRGTGAHLLSYAIAQNIKVTALIRDNKLSDKLQSQGVQTLVGNACNQEDVLQAMHLAGKDTTIVCTLGGEGANYEAQRTIIDSAEQFGIQQMLLVTSIGCGNSWPTLSDKAKQAFGYAVREKSLSEVWLQTSHLTYCILRPGGLVDGEPNFTAEYYPAELEKHGRVKRSDLAQVILKLIEQPLDNKIYSVIDPKF